MLFLCLLLLTSPAFADEGVALKRGEKAPYNGTLLSPDAIAQIITSADAELGQCKIDAKKDMDLAKSDFNYQLKMKIGPLFSSEGLSEGIHWHINENIKVEYIATDKKRETIPWVRYINTETLDTVVYEDQENPIDHDSKTQ